MAALAGKWDFRSGLRPHLHIICIVGVGHWSSCRPDVSVPRLSYWKPGTGPEQAPNRPRDEARKLEPSPDVLYRLLHPHGGCSGSRSAVANVFALAARQRDIIYNALSILLARIAGELWGLSGHNGRCLSSWEERSGRRTRLQLLLANS